MSRQCRGGFENLKDPMWHCCHNSTYNRKIVRCIVAIIYHQKGVYNMMIKDAYKSAYRLVGNGEMSDNEFE